VELLLLLLLLLLQAVLPLPGQRLKGAHRRSYLLLWQSQRNDWCGGGQLFSLETTEGGQWPPVLFPLGAKTKTATTTTASVLTWQQEQFELAVRPQQVKEVCQQQQQFFASHHHRQTTTAV
jgi:hypothetical protein